jgi:hypothetical protein
MLWSLIFYLGVLYIAVMARFAILVLCRIYLMIQMQSIPFTIYSGGKLKYK